MGELPKELIEALQNKEQAQLKHRWAFSFMPVQKQRPRSIDAYTTDIYLVGYCSVCDTSVSSIVKFKESKTTSARARIPKWGCIPVDELG